MVPEGRALCGGRVAALLLQSAAEPPFYPGILFAGKRFGPYGARFASPSALGVKTLSAQYLLYASAVKRSGNIPGLPDAPETAQG